MSKKANERKVEKLLYETNKNDTSNMLKTTEGFSIGIKPNKDLNLKKRRKEELIQRNQEFNKFFNFQNITTYNKPFLETNKENINNQRSLTEESIREKIKKKKEENLNAKKLKNKKKMESVQKK